MGAPDPAPSADELFDVGLTAQMRGDVDTAVVRFTEVLARYPFYAQAYLQLGKCETRRGDIPAAMDALRRGIKVAPQSAPLLAELGFLQLATGDLGRARKVLGAARRLAKRNVRVLQGLAWLHVRQRNWARASKVLRELLAASGSNFAGHYLLAQVHEAEGRLAEAHAEWTLTEDICREMIDSMEAPVAAEYFLGEILRVNGDGHGAREHYEAAAALAPDGADGLVFGMGLAVAWDTVLERAATACEEAGDVDRAAHWSARRPAGAEAGG